MDILGRMSQNDIQYVTIATRRFKMQYINDYTVESWEQVKAPLRLYVCSLCGLIADRMLEHGECGLQDWWHLHAKCCTESDLDEWDE